MKSLILLLHQSKHKFLVLRTDGKSDPQPGIGECTKYAAGNLAQASCDEEEAYVCCRLPAYMEFMLRGISSRLPIPKKYIWLEQDKKFYGIDEYDIVSNRSGWVIQERVSKKVVLQLSDVMPIGKGEWKSLWHVDAGAIYNMSLDLCNNQEFNCNDGTCIDISARCNYNKDCRKRRFYSNTKIVD